MQWTIRKETPEDYRAVEQLTREAFWNVYMPGCMEHYYLHNMRGLPAFVPQLSQVALEGGQLVGHIAYQRARIALDEGGDREVLCFGPVSVLPARQRRGVGGALIAATLRQAREMGYKAVVILGDVCYYSRFGFHMAERHLIKNQDGLWAAALLALELTPGALDQAAGRFLEPAVPMDEKGFNAFESTFSQKEKGSSPTQARFQVLGTLAYREGKAPWQG